MDALSDVLRVAPEHNATPPGGPAVVLFAGGDSRMTAILRDNVLLGSPAIQAVGQVTVAGNQH